MEKITNLENKLKSKIGRAFEIALPIVIIGAGLYFQNNWVIGFGVLGLVCGILRPGERLLAFLNPGKKKS